MAVTIAGRQFWLWRAVDDEGEVLDLLVQRRRDKAAAVKLMRKLLKRLSAISAYETARGFRVGRISGSS
jgi:transposase-like protein